MQEDNDKINEIMESKYFLLTYFYPIAKITEKYTVRAKHSVDAEEKAIIILKRQLRPFSSLETTKITWKVSEITDKEELQTLRDQEVAFWTTVQKVTPVTEGKKFKDLSYTLKFSAATRELEYLNFIYGVISKLHKDFREKYIMDKDNPNRYIMFGQYLETLDEFSTKVANRMTNLLNSKVANDETN